MKGIAGVIYNLDGVITNTVKCPSLVLLFMQAGAGEFAMLGEACDSIHKVELSGPFPKLVKKTNSEIEQDKPVYPHVPEHKMQANITNGQLQDILDRLKKMEKA